MAKTFKIHPAIGIARVGDSDAFYLSPEAPGQLPIAANLDGTAKTKDGKEQSASTFKKDGKVLRQGARFRVYAYDEDDQEGAELAIGDRFDLVETESGQVLTVELLDIEWTCYLANKKSVWYQFEQLEGEHGYGPDHPRRNAEVTDQTARQQLIIDPGPQTVAYKPKKSRAAAFARGANPGVPQSFPPPLSPNPIDTLGEILCTEQDGHNRLVVLGGHGNSGSYKTGIGQPRIETYANNPGWFDDTSDGPVNAKLVYKILKVNGKKPATGGYTGTHAQRVNKPAWVLVGYPAYVPEIPDMVTMDETIYDVMVRERAYDIDLYGVPPFDGTQKPPQTSEELALWRKKAQYNPDYVPHFWSQIWPILKRPDTYQWVLDFDPFTGGQPHNTGVGSNLNFDPTQLSVPPQHDQDPDERRYFRQKRMFIWKILRKAGQENQYLATPNPKNPQYQPRLMPLLCGDNPISNTLVDKFFRLTDTMLFLLEQWANGIFVNERLEHIEQPPADGPPSGTALDRGVLSNLLGGAFCPGGEAAWIVRNPAIYDEPFRLKQSPSYAAGSLSQDSDFVKGLEPGDVTKYSAVPWQSDFNECSTQPIDITYEQFNEIYPVSEGDPVEPIIQTTFWWPTHRPLEVFSQAGGQIPWSPLPVTNQGDLGMVTLWSKLGFVLNVGTAENPQFVDVERDPDLPTTDLIKPFTSD